MTLKAMAYDFHTVSPHSLSIRAGHAGRIYPHQDKCEHSSGEIYTNLQYHFPLIGQFFLNHLNVRNNGCSMIQIFVTGLSISFSLFLNVGISMIVYILSVQDYNDNAVC